MNRLHFAFALLLALATPLAFADAPATQPVAPPQVDVLVLPFAALDNQPIPPWISTGVQQNLLADLGRAHFHPIAQKQPITDAATAQTAGQAARAKFVIFGTIQSIDQMLRFDGQVLEVQTGKIVSGISQTAALRDLFALEDSLSHQAISSLRQQTQAAIAAANPPPAAAPPAANQRPHARPYEGSDLQAYLDSGRTPSNDYPDQYRSLQNRQTYYPYETEAYWPWYGYTYAPFNAGYGSSFGNWYSYGGSYYGYGTPFMYLRGTPGTPRYFSTNHPSE